MAYNRWLSGSQTYQQNDLMHYGRKGMRWGKHLFGLPENFFQKLKFGQGLDFKSLQNLLQRGEIDFNVFKQLTKSQSMFEQIANQRSGSGSATGSTVKRSAQQTRSLANSVGNSVKERKAAEDRSRAIAEEKARQGRQDEEKSRQEAARKKQAEQRIRASAKERRQSNNEGNSKLTSPQTQTNSQSAEKTADENYNEALLKYINDLKSDSDEEARLRREENKKKLAEERDREIREKEQKLVSIIWKIGRFLNRLV